MGSETRPVLMVAFFAMSISLLASSVDSATSTTTSLPQRDGQVHNVTVSTRDYWQRWTTALSPTAKNSTSWWEKFTTLPWWWNEDTTTTTHRPSKTPWWWNNDTTTTPWWWNEATTTTTRRPSTTPWWWNVDTTTTTRRPSTKPWWWNDHTTTTPWWWNEDTTATVTTNNPWWRRSSTATTVPWWRRPTTTAPRWWPFQTTTMRYDWNRDEGDKVDDYDDYGNRPDSIDYESDNSEWWEGNYDPGESTVDFDFNDFMDQLRPKSNKVPAWVIGLTVSLGMLFMISTVVAIIMIVLYRKERAKRADDTRPLMTSQQHPVGAMGHNPPPHYIVSMDGMGQPKFQPGPTPLLPGQEIPAMTCAVAATPTGHSPPASDSMPIPSYTEVMRDGGNGTDTSVAPYQIQIEAPSTVTV